MRELENDARRNDGGRLQWFVLRWNDGARRFYESLGAAALDEWLLMDLDFEAKDARQSLGQTPHRTAARTRARSPSGPRRELRIDVPCFDAP